MRLNQVNADVPKPFYEPLGESLSGVFSSIVFRFCEIEILTNPLFIGFRGVLGSKGVLAWPLL